MGKLANQDSRSGPRPWAVLDQSFMIKIFVHLADTGNAAAGVRLLEGTIAALKADQFKSPTLRTWLIQVLSRIAANPKVAIAATAPTRGRRPAHSEDLHLTMRLQQFTTVTLGKSCAVEPRRRALFNRSPRSSAPKV